MGEIVLLDFGQIIGLQVATLEAIIIGEVKGARFDPSTWTINYLNVKLMSEVAEFLGVKKRFSSSTICLPVNLVKTVGHAITISKSIEDLKNSKEILGCIE